MNVTTLNTTTLDGNVIIKKGGGTPTPPSGGGDWRYFDRTQKEPANEAGMQLALFTLFKDAGSIMPMSYAVAVHGNEFYKQATCFAIDLNMPFIVSGAPFSTVGEFMTMNGIDLDTLVASFNYTEITEDEFYTLFEQIKNADVEN